MVTWKAAWACLLILTAAVAVPVAARAQDMSDKLSLEALTAPQPGDGQHHASTPRGSYRPAYHSAYHPAYRSAYRPAYHHAYRPAYHPRHYAAARPHGTYRRTVYAPRHTGWAHSPRARGYAYAGHH